MLPKCHQNQCVQHRWSISALYTCICTPGRTSVSSCRLALHCSLAWKAGQLNAGVILPPGRTHVPCVFHSWVRHRRCYLTLWTGRCYLILSPCSLVSGIWAIFVNILANIGNICLFIHDVQFDFNRTWPCVPPPPPNASTPPPPRPRALDGPSVHHARPDWAASWEHRWIISFFWKSS